MDGHDIDTRITAIETQLYLLQTQVAVLEAQLTALEELVKKLQEKKEPEISKIEEQLCGGCGVDISKYPDCDCSDDYSDDD